MSPRETAWDDWATPVPAAPQRLTGPWNWVGLLACPPLAVQLWRVGAPPLWWALPAVLLGVALLGRATRRVVWMLLRPVVRWPLLTVPAAAGAVAWVAGGFWGRVTVCVVGAVLLAAVLTPRLRREPNTEGDEEGSAASWAERAERDWPVTARAAELVGPGEDALPVPLLGAPTEPARGALELVLDLGPVLLLPEDVRRAEPALRRHLRADVVRVRPEQVVDAARVRAYRRHPMDLPVSWRDLVALDDETGEWLPVGVDEWGGQAAIRWRIPLLITGAQDSGKTALIRAGIAGATVQRIPVRWWIWDNRADFRGLRPIAHRYASTTKTGLALLRELDAELDALIESSPDLDTGYVRTPRLSTPADVLIVGELLTALDGPAEVERLLKRRARDGRALAHGTWATAQTSTKDRDDVGPIRDLFVQKACCRVESDSLVDPALGSGALERGAHAHRIPPSLHGATLLIDPATKDPYYLRSAFVPAADTDAAIVRPYQALMGRRLSVIDGELG